MGPLVCDHFRAPSYFIESLSPQCMQNMKGFPCRNSNEFDRARCLTNCKNGVCPDMGYNAGRNGNQILGKHFLYTTTSAPFCGKYILCRMSCIQTLWLDLENSYTHVLYNPKR